MADSANFDWRSSGLRRLINALRYQSDGIRHGLRHDSAIRQVSFACIALSLLVVFLPVSGIECLLLVLSLMLIVLVEYLNSALEAIVDRISLEPNPLSKLAKNYGSVAVGIAALMSALCWVVIAGPPLYKWFLSCC